MELLTAAAYIRVSTDNQTELSPDSQIKLVKEYAKKHGYIIPKEFIFRDDGISGRHADKRPEFIKMIGISKQKPSPFSAVLLWKFSRFARNQEESIFYKGMLRKNGVEVISVSEPIIDGVFGSLIERIIEWTDEYYSIRLSGEVKRGMTEKVERGGAVSIPSFGYDIIDKNYVPNEKASIVQSIYRDYLNGVGSMTIARRLNALGIRTTRGNPWENRTVDYILQNPVYIGKIRWNPKRRTRRDFDDPDIMIVDGHHEPIIDEDTFNKVQEIISYNKRKHSRYTHDNVSEEYMLHGLVKCSNCGASLSISAKGTSLQCIGYTHGRCKVSHSIAISKINDLVLNAIDAAFITGTFDLIIKPIHPEEPTLDYEALIEKERTKLKRVRDAYEDGVYTLEEFKETKAIIDEHINSLSVAQGKAQSAKQISREEFIEKNKNVTERLRDPLVSEAEKNDILKSIVDRIIFDRKNATIHIFFYT